MELLLKELSRRNIQDNEIVAFLSKNDIFGDSKWRDSKAGKSVVHVRALTYCDIHTINVDDLKKVDIITKFYIQNSTKGR